MDIPENAEIVKGPETLPCGCMVALVIADGIRNMVIKPCKASCTNYRNALQEGREQGKKIEYKEKL